ncbi:MAG TPA: DNA polymerase III subunit gamma/tau [Vicinamibacterales bacterium]|nr:DNA polymerase III subunit gamma/tau [Vicinamibacterales bacterium]
MAYQVLARKWRPQKFDDVVGQAAVTRTLRNAIASNRIAHAFVFAGQRGSGKTTTARILARALNCVSGPTVDPCGECDACVEIAQSRDMDVLEIDAASHTGIDNIREVVISGLSISPVRDRYKIFIIDEVHQLSPASFNALLKSIEEPPAHVLFIMATTELHKIPDTILSRSQVFEFRAFPTRVIADHLKRMVKEEGIEVPDAALALIARAAEGSMRDAQSALDQVMAFAGQTITVDDVATVLGLVGRDLLFEVIEAVIAEDGPRAFAATDRAVESGHDLRLIIRELTKVVRDMMMVAVDPARAGEGDLAEGEIERLMSLARQFSREDLMRAFDLLAKAEQDIRTASHPRYHIEMLLLRWMHLRKLVPLMELLEGGGGGAPVRSAVAPTSGRLAPTGSKLAPTSSRLAPTSSKLAPAESKLAPTNDTLPPTSDTIAPAAGLKDKFLAEIRSNKNTLYSLAVAQAHRIDVSDDRITFTFAPNQNVARMQLDSNKEWLEGVAHRLSGRRIQVISAQVQAETSPASGAAPAGTSSAPKRDLKEEARSSPSIQAMLDVFPADIRDVEEF